MKSYQYLSGGVNYSDQNIYCNDIKDFFYSYPQIKFPPMIWKTTLPVCCVAYSKS